LGEFPQDRPYIRPELPEKLTANERFDWIFYWNVYHTSLGKRIKKKLLSIKNLILPRNLSKRNYSWDV